MHILVVDDHATNRQILDGHLRRWGAIVTIADSGEAALTLLAQAAQQGAPGRFGAVGYSHARHGWIGIGGRHYA